MDSDSERMMLVYEHKTQGRKLVPGGVSIMSEEEIVVSMSSHPDVYMVTKALLPGQISLDLFKADLVRDEDRVKLVEPGTTVEDGAEEVPWRVFLGHAMEGHQFEELVILTANDEKKIGATNGVVEAEVEGPLHGN